MNKVEKYLMEQIEEKERLIKHYENVIERLHEYEMQYFKEQRFINIVSEKASIKSFESSDGTIKRYIDLGDINNYGSDQSDYGFVVNLLGINKYADPECECCDCECTECSDCECEDCFEGSEEDE